MKINRGSQLNILTDISAIYTIIYYFDKLQETEYTALLYEIILIYMMNQWGLSHDKAQSILNWGIDSFIQD